MNTVKRIKRNNLIMYNGGYFHPTGLTNKEHETIAVKWKRGKCWVKFKQGTEITSKVYIIRASSYKRVGAMISVRCRHCKGYGYIINRSMPGSWQKEYACKCINCDYGLIWYEYIPQTKEWSRSP